MKSFLLVSFALSVLIFGGCNQSAAVAPMTVIIVRHAEKISDEENSPLNDAGIKRAEALAAALEKSGVQAIYASQFDRNKNTARPLAERAGLNITEMPVDLKNPGDYGKNLAQEIISKNSGKTVLIVGHGNTIEATIESLTGEPIDLGDVQYSDLFIVTARGAAPESKGKLVRAQYGIGR